VPRRCAVGAVVADVAVVVGVAADDWRRRVASSATIHSAGLALHALSSHGHVGREQRS